MQGFGRYRIHIILLIGLALVIRLAVWYAYVQQPGAFVQPDTVTYLAPGEQLLDAGTFPSFARTPVYPIFLAVVSKAVSSNPALIALVHIGVSLATLALTFYLTGSIFGVGTGLVVLFFLATDLTSAISSKIASMARASPSAAARTGSARRSRGVLWLRAWKRRNRSGGCLS